jgi:chromate reductase
MSYEILGISGTFRRHSFNRMALEAAGSLMPEGMRLRITRYDDVPLYNQDVEEESGFPASVQRLAAEIAAADGVLIASPDYNHSIAGVLKNAIDWVSRVDPQPFFDKPVAIISATKGPVGGARNQYELRKVIASCEGLCLGKPEVFIGRADTKFDSTGRLVDEPTRLILGTQMRAFQAWIARVSG